MAEYAVEGGGLEDLPPPPFSGSYKGGRLGLPEAGRGSLATFWPRFGGLLIDELVLLPVIVVSVLVRNAHRTLVVDPSGHRHYVYANAIAVVAAAVTTAIGGTYVIVLIGRRGKTVGQAAMGLVTLRIDDRAIPGYAVAARRWAIIGAIAIVNLLLELSSAQYATTLELFVPFVSVLVLAWMLWDLNRQGLHDKIGGTIVVRTR
jgi:uncharacterized RDD family membrane protein YckC